MEVTRYIFQSPYSSQVQVGRADTVSVGSKNTADSSSGLDGAINQALSNAENFEATQVKELELTISSDSILDIYA
ncbi:hypothetical protein HUE87_11330 [Candidatus Sulfurimonas marisnigri]|uniref:Uncharacterized protein n=1 Tax=Candidatus Sulfurimonas marisnigri TaxID=2740405 RepID=A0A7S7M0Q1_9BACT|nr:hypothetical protein [Candidatus Sulfurimonas marisnigri]QOY54453.1 hypothetical protein HUE87_11330 [Candidatus Sulfurimonas marisnigri]